MNLINRFINMPIRNILSAIEDKQYDHNTSCHHRDGVVIELNCLVGAIIRPR